MAVNAGQRRVPDTAGNRALDACDFTAKVYGHTKHVSPNERREWTNIIKNCGGKYGNSKKRNANP